MSETRKCERGKDCGLPNVHCRAPECFAATPPTPDRAAVRGEPEYAEVSDEQIIAHFDSLAALRMDSIGADAWHIAFKRAAYAMRQLRAHPAPSGGEAVAEYWCVMFGDNEHTGEMFDWENEARERAAELDAKRPDGPPHVVVRLVLPRAALAAREGA